MFSIPSFIRTSLALSLLLLPFAHLKAGVFGIPLYSIELPILFALIAYAYGWKRRIFSPAETIDFRNPFCIGIAIFFFSALLSFVMNPFSLSGLGMLKTWFVFPLLALWLWLETKPADRDLERMLFVWLGTLVLSALASLMFFFQGILTYDGRLAAWYASPNYLAFFLAPGILLASYFFASPRLAKRRFFLSLLRLSIVALAAALFLTRSYEVWVSVCAALIIFLFLDKRALPSWRKKLAASLLLIGVFSLFIFFESGSEKWQSLAAFDERSSLASRLMIWEAAVRIIADHPFFGIGIGRFQETYLSYQQYFPPYLEWAVPQPHNLYLALWLQTGLMGLLGFGFLITVWLWKMTAWLCAETSGYENGYAKRTHALLVSLLVSLLILGLVDTPFFKTDLAFMFWIVLAFGIGSLNAQKKRTEP